MNELPFPEPDLPPPTAPGTARVSRRGFLKIGAAATGGLLVSLCWPGRSDAGAAADDPFAPNVFLRIDPDDAVTITIPKSEMGQGVRTSLAMILAEELDADWARVRVEQAPYGERFGGQGTGGSGSVRSRWMPFRQAGAAARQMLVRAAAAGWGVDASACETEPSAVVHRPTGRRLSYGALAGAAAKLPVPENPPLKDPKTFRIVGRPTRGVDVPDIVTGRAVYGMDVRVPGMRYASVERSPVFGGRLASFDGSAALRVPGVLAVVEVPGGGYPHYVSAGVAVVAETTWAALQGRKALRVTWDEGSGAADSSAGFTEQMERLTAAPGQVVHDAGDAEAALSGAAKRIEAVYHQPFLSHATMEPMNCTALVEGDRCTVWAPTQNPGSTARAVAESLGTDLSKVTVNVTLMGGGFGRRLWSDYAAEAALVARAAGVPVKVVWTREDDLQHDFYRPANLHRLEAALDGQGFPLAWRHRLASTPIAQTSGGPEAKNLHGSEVPGASDMPYRVPDKRVEYAPLLAAVTRGWWRSVAHSHTTFAVESFLDELAAAAGRDPYEYRLALLDESSLPPADKPYAYDPRRLRGVLRLAAERAGWGGPLPPGRARGIACQYSFSSYAAEVFEVSVDPQDGLRVHRVVAAVDAGPIVNPDGARAQVQGAIVDGLSAALHGEITLKDGRVEQSNFHDYPLLRMQETPREIEVHFIETDAPPTGLGEPALPPVSAALANAIFAATGKRIRRLPIRPESLI